MGGWDAVHEKKTKNAFRHFSTNFDKRPRILAFQIKSAISAGTFALNRRKVASRLFDRKSGRNGVGIGPCGVGRGGNEARRRGENFGSAGS